MKKIAYIVCNINKIGGTERAVINIANTLCKDNNLEIYIISMFSETNNDASFKIDKSINIINLKLHCNSKIQTSINYLLFIHKINKIIKRYELDIVLGTTHAMNCLLTFCRHNAKLVGCEHTVYGACPHISSIIRKKRYPKLDAVVLLTESDAEHYSFLDAQKKYVIPNIISFHTNTIAPLDNKIIIAAGRLASVKRYDLLIDLAVEIKKELPDWKIHIFGDGECKNDLQNRIEEKNVQDYVFLKGSTNDIKKEILNSSIMVMTSKYEGLPMILIEGQVCGLPIVSFDCPEGPRNIINNEINGYLIPMNNNKLFIKRVSFLAKNEEIRKKFGEESFIASKKYNPESVAKLWKHLFEID